MAVMGRHGQKQPAEKRGIKEGGKALPISWGFHNGIHVEFSYIALDGPETVVHIPPKVLPNSLGTLQIYSPDEERC